MSGVVKQVTAARAGDHLCLAFDTDGEQREVVASFIVAGLTKGEKIIYFTDGTAPEMVTRWLRARSVDAHAAWARGQLEMRHAEQAYLRSGRFDPDEALDALRADIAAAQRAGFTGVRLTDEMAWARRGLPGSERLPDYERRIQAIYDTGAATGICQFDRRIFGAETGKWVRLHQGRVEPDPLHADPWLRVVPTFDPRGLRVVGTVDTTTSTAMTAALDRWSATEPGDIHLDMKDLEFIDIAGLRTLVTAASELDGRRLHVVNLAPSLRRVVTLVGWDREPGLVFCDRAVGA
jgi:anti-anti-sigma factor